MNTKQNKLTEAKTPTTKVERLPDMVASDFQEAVKWVKKHPLKATAFGVVAVVALRNKTFRGLLGSAAVAFISSKVANSVEHTLH